MIRYGAGKHQATALPAGITGALWGIIEGSIQPTEKNAKIMEAERINALSSLLSDLTSREAELRRYL
ncbi:hypothetical protein NX774_07775 [Massilia agilis]|uniref:Uncharacterized protein n=1 Tax=Massilia agilis TaxID=1811226 RepID=A0ABT2D950_9BURK|nr:hypothetical protein [Massilia agilis]MCS0807821.1 hypothetical protein [Massilia agilis]